MHVTDKHIFSLFTQTCLAPYQSLLPEGNFTLADADLWRRIFTVLRLEEGDECMIFDGQTAVHIILADEKTRKNIIRGTVIEAHQALPLAPSIHLYQGLLRRDAFDSVIYTAAQMGVTTVTPVLSKKIQRQWADDRELTRVEKVIIAGCEQAKQFVAPVVNQPMSFENLKNTIVQTKGYWLCLNPSGRPFIDLITSVTRQANSSLHVIIGPEGGFIPDEHNALHDAGVHMFALTPTVLRSVDAAVLVLGTLRSIVSTVE